MIISSNIGIVWRRPQERWYEMSTVDKNPTSQPDLRCRELSKIDTVQSSTFVQDI